MFHTTLLLIAAVGADPARCSPACTCVPGVRVCSPACVCGTPIDPTVGRVWTQQAKPVVYAVDPVVAAAWAKTARPVTIQAVPVTQVPAAAPAAVPAQVGAYTVYQPQPAVTYYPPAQSAPPAVYYPQASQTGRRTMYTYYPSASNGSSCPNGVCPIK